MKCRVSVMECLVITCLAHVALGLGAAKKPTHQHKHSACWWQLVAQWLENHHGTLHIEPPQGNPPAHSTHKGSMCSKQTDQLNEANYGMYEPHLCRGFRRHHTTHHTATHTHQISHIDTTNCPSCSCAAAPLPRLPPPPRLPPVPVPVPVQPAPSVRPPPQPRPARSLRRPRPSHHQPPAPVARMHGLRLVIRPNVSPHQLFVQHCSMIAHLLEVSAHRTQHPHLSCS